MDRRRMRELRSLSSAQLLALVVMDHDRELSIDDLRFIREIAVERLEEDDEPEHEELRMQVEACIAYPS